MFLTRPGQLVVGRLAATALLLNVLLVVSGGVVRLTGSGLGCPSWPRCTSASLATTPELGIHGSIEFGNRLLGVVLEVVGVALVVAVFRIRPNPPTAWRWLAAVQALVVPAQAVVGGVLVLTQLNPYVRTLHFLISFPIAFAAAALLRRVLDGPGTREPVTGPELRLLVGALVATAAAVTVVGALVTGTGPHAGDPRSSRLPFDPRDITQFHADLVFLLLGLVLATVVTARHAPTRVRRPLTVTVVLVLAQGLLGYVQYYTGVPPLLVGLHMLGATLVFTTVAWTYLSSVAPVAPWAAAQRSQRDLADHLA